MNIAQIEKNLHSLVEFINKDTFIYDLLLAYGTPKASISRLQKGNLNLSKVDGEIDWKKKLFFKTTFLETPQEQFKAVIENQKAIKHEPRFVVITDYQTLLALDTKTQDKLEITINDLPTHFDFFLPWAGMEKAQHANENPADVKAAGKMAKLFDEIKKDNPGTSASLCDRESAAEIHALNVFLSRLLFCFFAEDTNIFADGQFTNAIDSHTQTDGSDLHTYLNKFFEVLNTPEKERKDLPAYLQAFPYVNGGLFRPPFQTPNFSRRSRQAIIDSGELQWKEINPDIFGSMFQAVVSVDQRGNLGQHYTSVPNIMKVIEPLFLNELYEAFEKAKGDKKKLNDLLLRISKIKIFDPACGSGNFLIIAYKELRKLEMKILKELGILAFSNISLSNFYGIEIDDFAHEIAQLSLWLAEHQMNVEFYNQFGRTNPTLPLREAGHIVQGNACRLDWEKVCPKQDGDEIYVLGNPPYLGSSMQNAEQKVDMEFVFHGKSDYKNLDYIACWFYNASKYAHKQNIQISFVSTNSICQGEQIGILWPYILDLKMEIGFAFNSFKWSNNAKSKAAVIVIIVGIRNQSDKKKFLYKESIKHDVKNINPYLINAPNIIFDRRAKSISAFPELVRGSMPTDDGNFSLTIEEMNSLVSNYPSAIKYIKKIISGGDFLNDKTRFCLWIEDSEFQEAYNIPFIKERLDAIREFRLNSDASTTVEYAKYPNRFRQIAYKESDCIVIPLTSSIRREYIPFSFLSKGTVVTNSAGVIYGAEAWLFSSITSKIHMVWVSVVAGRLKTDFRYSNVICYNNFPFPPISDKQKEELTMCTFRILEEREKHSEKTLAQLYDPDKMPEGLLEAHRLNDLAVERCYRSKPFESDEERLEYLFKLYEQMIEEEKNKGTLFAGKAKKKKSNTKKK